MESRKAAALPVGFDIPRSRSSSIAAGVGDLSGLAKQFRTKEAMNTRHLLGIAVLVLGARGTHAQDFIVPPDFAQLRPGLPATSNGTPGGSYCGPTCCITATRGIRRSLQYRDRRAEPAIAATATAKAEAPVAEGGNGRGAGDWRRGSVECHERAN